MARPLRRRPGALARRAPGRIPRHRRTHRRHPPPTGLLPGASSSRIRLPLLRRAAPHRCRGHRGRPSRARPGAILPGSAQRPAHQLGGLLHPSHRSAADLVRHPRTDAVRVAPGLQGSGAGPRRARRGSGRGRPRPTDQGRQAPARPAHQGACIRVGASVRHGGRDSRGAPGSQPPGARASCPRSSPQRARAARARRTGPQPAPHPERGHGAGAGTEHLRPVPAAADPLHHRWGPAPVQRRLASDVGQRLEHLDSHRGRLSGRRHPVAGHPGPTGGPGKAGRSGDQRAHQRSGAPGRAPGGAGGMVRRRHDDPEGSAAGLGGTRVGPVSQPPARPGPRAPRRPPGPPRPALGAAGPGPRSGRRPA